MKKKKNTTKNERGVREKMEQKYVYGSKRTKENQLITCVKEMNHENWDKTHNNVSGMAVVMVIL